MDSNQSTEKYKVLFVSQEITPYVNNTLKSDVCRYLAQGIQERNKEIRTFMPRFGIINERRNQLHEVIRLSGMNLIINDVDHQVIIKVASLSQVRMQIYFIDNVEYFKRKAYFHDEDGNFFDDNDERSLFFSRGVLETVKKLGWMPNIINCHGWMDAFIPLYVNKIYRNNPIFTNAKIVTTLYADDFKEDMSANLYEKLEFDGISKDDAQYFVSCNYISLMKNAIDNSNAVIFAEENIHPELIDYVKEKNKPVLSYHQYDMNYLANTTDEFFADVVGY